MNQRKLAGGSGPEAGDTGGAPDQLLPPSLARRAQTERTDAIERMDAHLRRLTDAQGRRLLHPDVEDSMKERLLSAARAPHPNMASPFEGGNEPGRRRMSEVGAGSGTVMMAIFYQEVDPPPQGDGSEQVMIEPELGAFELLDSSGNVLPPIKHNAGPLNAQPSGSLPPAGVVVKMRDWGTGSGDCGDNSTMKMGSLINPMVALVHGMLHTSHAMLPYATTALKLGSALPRNKGDKRNRFLGTNGTPKWGPAVWFVGLVASLVLLCQVAINSLVLPWTIALAPLWLLESATLGWLVRTAGWQKDDATKSSTMRWLPVVRMCLDFALHLGVSLMADVYGVSGMVVLAVALPQLLVSLGATNAEAKRRSLNQFARKGGQLLLFLEEVCNWLLVGAMVILAAIRPDWTIQCVGSWVWALAPFWITAVLLLLHQLWMLFLWRCLRPKGKATPAGEPLLAQSPSQSKLKTLAELSEKDRLKHALGFAIREQLAHGGDLTDAVRLVRDQVDQARRDGVPLSEQIGQMVPHTSPPWMALGAEFESVYGRPPQTEAELVGFAKAMIEETRAADIRLGEALDNVSVLFAAQFSAQHGGRQPGAAELHSFAKQAADEARGPAGMRGLDQQLQLALNDQQMNVNGKPFDSESQTLIFLDRLIDGMDDPDKLVEPLPLRLQEALHQQILACGRGFESEQSGQGEREEAMQMLKSITDQPGGAAASVVLLQDQSTDVHEAALPEAVRLAVAVEFEAQNGRPPYGEEETVRFFKEMMASGTQPGFGGPSLSLPAEVQLAATNAFAAANNGAAPPTQLAALQALELCVKDNTAVLRSEGLPPQLHEALMADAQQGSTFGSQMVMDREVEAVGFALNTQFETNNGRPPADATELHTFAKQLATGGLSALGQPVQLALGGQAGAAAQLQFLEQAVLTLESRATLQVQLQQGFSTAFEGVNGRPPADAVELHTFAKQQLDQAHAAGGVRALDQSMQQALAAEHHSLFGSSGTMPGAAPPSLMARSETQQLAFFEQLVAGLDGGANTEALGKVGGSRSAAEQLDALIRHTEAAGGGGGQFGGIVMPPDVSAAAAAAFTAERGHSPASEAETLRFLKDKLAEAPEAQLAAASILAPLQSVAPEAANAFAGPATLDVAPQSLAPRFDAAQNFSLQSSGAVSAAERDVLTAAKGAAGATAVESLLASAIVQQQQTEQQQTEQQTSSAFGGATLNLPMLPPAIALAVQSEFATRFDGSTMQSEGEITRFAKSIANDFDHDARRASGMSEGAGGGRGAPASLRNTKLAKFSAVARLSRGMGGSRAQPTLPGTLRGPPSGFALAAAFDEVKADDHAAHVATERMSVGKSHATAAAASHGDRRRSVLTAQKSFSDKGHQQVRMSEFGAVATLHGLGESTHMSEQPVVKFGLTLDGTVENFDELAVKQRLLKEMGGGPGGRHPELTIDDITLEIKRGSVIILASVRTKSSRCASAASAAVTTLLQSSARTADAFRMPIKSGTEIKMPTVAVYVPPGGGLERKHTNPLSGAQLQQAIVEALSQEESLVMGGIGGVHDGGYDAEAEAEEGASRALRRASYACGLSIPVILLCVIAAVFGGGADAAAVPLALGGLAVIGLVAIAYYFLRKSRRSRAETVSKRAALLRSDSQRAGANGGSGSSKGGGAFGRGDVEAPRSPGRGGGAGVLSPPDMSALSPPGSGSKAATAFVSSGFGGDGRVAPVSASPYRAPPPAATATYGGLTDPEARMQARLGRFGAPAAAAPASPFAVSPFAVSPSPSVGSAARLVPVPRPPSMPRPQPIPSTSQSLLPPIKSPAASLEALELP